jgi:hypothetical protein
MERDGLLNVEGDLYLALTELGGRGRLTTRTVLLSFFS